MKRVRKQAAKGKAWTKAVEYGNLPRELRVQIANEAKSNPLHTGNENSVIVQALDEYFTKGGRMEQKTGTKDKATKAGRKHLAKTEAPKSLSYNEWNVKAYADDLIACGRMAENCVAMLENHTPARHLARIHELLREALITAEKLENIGQDIATLIRK